MNLWEEYKNVLHDTISLHNGVGSVWANWKSKGTHLTAKTYTNKYLIKILEKLRYGVILHLYTTNNILYPKNWNLIFLLLV